MAASTVCDIDGLASADAFCSIEGVGRDFARLLRELAVEHRRVKLENARSLAGLQHGLIGSRPESHPTKFERKNGDEEHVDSKEGFLAADVSLEGSKGMAQQYCPSSSLEETSLPDPKLLPRQISGTNGFQDKQMHQVWTSTDRLRKAQSEVSRGQTLKLSGTWIRGGDTQTDDSFMQRFIVKPNSWKRMLWDVCSIVVLIIDILMVPMMAFDIEEQSVLQMISITCASFWTLDIPANIISGFHYEGIIEMRPKKVLMNYWRSWFAFDVIIVLMDWTLFFLTSDIMQLGGLFRASKLLRLGRVIRAFRLLRLLRLLKMPSLLDDLADYMGTAGLVIAFRVLKALGTIAVANHFLACGWYAVGKSSTPSWITELDNENRDLAFRYASALHWSLTQFTPASMEIYPRGLPERVYSICVLFLALVVFSSFVSSITNAMNHLRQINEVRSRQRDNLRRYIHDNKLSLELANRITAFVKHLDVCTTTRVHWNEIEAFKVLPESLRLQLHWEVYVPIMSIHPFFFLCAECFEPFVLKLCVTALDEVSLITGQELFSQDAEAKQMYFAVSGTLEYFEGNTDIQDGVVSQREWCCEVALWLTWIHKGQLVALSRAELVSLDASAFRKIASRSAEMYEVCRRYASAFFERAESWSAEIPLDVFCDHGHALEISHLAFAHYESRSEAESPGASTSWKLVKNISFKSVFSKLGSKKLEVPG